MAHEELKSKNKGRRSLPPEKDFDSLYREIKREKKDRLTIQEIVENQAVVNALADILVEEGIIKEKDDISPEMRIQHATDLYGGVLSALISIIQEDGLVEDLENKLEDGILAAHRTMMHFGTRLVSIDEVIRYRREVYRSRRTARKN